MSNTYLLCKGMVLLLGLSFMVLPTASQAAEEHSAKPSILVTAIGDAGMQFLIDPVLEGKLKAAGYRVASMYADDLTWDRLKLFDEVIFVQEYLPPDVLSNAAQAGQPDPMPRLRAVQDLLLRYVREGGGLLQFFDEFHYTPEWDYHLNDFLSKLDASASRESFEESNPENVYIFPLLQDNLKVFRTTNFASHPVTAGVREFWYPAMIHLCGTLHVGKDWHVVANGSETAHTANTYRSAPPVLAVRDYGKGKVALIAGHSSFYVNNGYHVAYENGWCFEKGDGMRLFTNLFDWLGSHEGSTQLGAYRDGMVPPLPVKGGTRIQKTGLLKGSKAFPGLIGVHTQHSGGAYTVADYAAKARKLGLKFVAFTDKIETKEEWNALKEECKKNTSADFVAIPGVEFKDVSGNQGYAMNIDEWPITEGIGRTSFIMTLLTAGHEHSGIYTLLQPRENPTLPQNLGGFNAFEVISLRGEASYSGALDWWRALQAIPGYSLLPVVSQRIWTLGELEKTAKDGFKLFLYAPSLDKLRAAPTWDLVPGFTSNGPVVDEFRVDDTLSDTWEHYYLWQPGDKARIHIKVSCSAALRDVVLYSGRKLIRRYYPKGRQFSVVDEYPMSEDGPFYLEARDVMGRVAYTYAVPTRNQNYWNHIGSDRMNNYSNPILPDKYGMVELPDGKRLGFGGLITYGAGWGTYCRWYHPAPTEAYHPQGYETGQIGAGLANLRTFPRLFSQATNEMDDVAPWRDYALASRDVAVVAEEFKHTIKDGKCQPSNCIEGSASTTWYRYKYRPFGYIIGMVETRAKVIADAVQLDKRTGLEVSLLEIAYKGTRDVKHYTYIDEQGRKVTGDIDPSKLQEPQTFRIGKGGYFTLWPDAFGLVALYALDEGITVELSYQGQAVLRAGYNLDNERLLRGREFSGKFMVVEEGGGQGPEVWDRLSSLWGSKLKYTLASDSLVMPFSTNIDHS